MKWLTLICCVALCGCGDSKKDDSNKSATPGETKSASQGSRAGKTKTLVNPTGDLSKLKEMTKNAQAAVPALKQLMARSLTSDDIKAFLAIRKELLPHRKMLRDPTKRAEYNDLRKAACKKHGVDNPLAYSVMSSRVRAALMVIKLKMDPAKLKGIKKGDFEVVSKHLDEVNAALKAR